jgi:ABC-type bacteriocin/lantibiotic exporter with double-glycine peptidase domain
MKIELPRLSQKEDYSCVPACIRIVLQHWGHDYAELKICEACKTSDRGTSQNQAVAGIKKLGFEVSKLKDEPFDLIIQFLHEGVPVIALLDVHQLPYARDKAGLHAVVVNGFDGDYVSFIDPARGDEIEFSVDTFLRAWQECGRLGLVIEPK